ncbi:MAG TPA: hypothetical protein PLV81_14140 [Spirochaetota bacterium]|nr:hypothetical protein [Spirochaetota bacterium]HOM11278.1 hypothetical protein [Spirochaetota bacterium]
MGIVIDINDFLHYGNVKYNLAHADKMLFDRCQAAICATTNLIKGEAIVTDISCKLFTDNPDCKGTVTVLITHVPNQIHWKCPACGSEGIIKNWKNSPLYIQFLKDSNQKSKQIKSITLSSEEFEKLVNLSDGLDECKAMIASAQKTGTSYTISVNTINVFQILEKLIFKIELKTPDRPFYIKLRDELKTAVI